MRRLQIQMVVFLCVIVSSLCLLLNHRYVRRAGRRECERKMTLHVKKRPKSFGKAIAEGDMFEEDPDDPDDPEDPVEVVTSNLPAPGIIVILSSLIGALFLNPERRQ